MFERYNPNKLKHVPGQEGIVDDVDKAEVMANEEALGREIAERYTKYILNPEGTALHEIEAYDTAIKKDFDELIKNGVTPEYIIAASEIWAERKGDMHDFEKQLENLSEEEIKARLRDLKKLEPLMSLSLFRENWFEHLSLHKQTDTSSRVNRMTVEKTFHEKNALLEKALSERKRERALNDVSESPEYT